MDEENVILLNKINQAKTMATKWHAPIRHRRNLYHFKHYEGMGKMKDGETRYADPTYTNTVDLAVGILHSNDFRWHVYGWSPDPQEMKDSSSIEKYLAGTLHVNSLREEEDIRLEIIQSFVRDGVACLYTVWDTKEARAHKGTIDEIDPESDEGTKKASVYLETPIIAKVIDPLNIYLLPGGANRWSAIMRAQSFSVFDVEHLWPSVVLPDFAALSDDEKRITDVEFIDYWEIERLDSGKTVVRNAHVVDREVIKPLMDMPGYEYLPYTVGFYTNDMSDDPSHWVKGLVDVLENSVSMLEIGVNRRQRMIDVYTGLPILVKAKAGRSMSLDKALNITTVEDDEDVRFPTWPGNPPDVEEQLAFFRSRAQQSGFSESMYGAGMSGVGSGYALSHETDQNRIRLTQPIANLQLFWTQWARKVLSMTQNFAKKSKIRVYGRVQGRDFVTLVPGKDSSAYLVECRIRPDFPTEKTRKHAMATQAAAVLSDQTLMTEYYDIEQPDDEQQRKMIEIAQKHPIVQQYAIMLNLMQLAKAGDEAAAMALESIKSQMGLGSGTQGKSGVTNETQVNPEQTAGMPSAGGQLTPQEQGQQPPGQSQEDQMRRQVGASPNMMGGI